MWRYNRGLVASAGSPPSLSLLVELLCFLCTAAVRDDGNIISFSTYMLIVGSFVDMYIASNKSNRQEFVSLFIMVLFFS